MKRFVLALLIATAPLSYTGCALFNNNERTALTAAEMGITTEQAALAAFVKWEKHQQDTGKFVEARLRSDVMRADAAFVSAGLAAEQAWLAVARAKVSSPKDVPMFQSGANAANARKTSAEQDVINLVFSIINKP